LCQYQKLHIICDGPYAPKVGDVLVQVSQILWAR
jgi:hypothetical protein